MIDFKNVTFIKSVGNYSDSPEPKLPEILLVGKSNVGKSSLINALTNRKNLAFTSKKPGHTRFLNYFNVDNKFYLVDAPGYGYAQGGLDLDSIFMDMMNSYFSETKHLSLVLVLIDSRRDLSVNDEEIIKYLVNNNMPYAIVLTKIDKVNQSELSKARKMVDTFGIDQKLVVYTSSNILRSLNSLKELIAKNI